MGRAIKLSSDHSSTTLLALARKSKDADQARRLLAVSLIYDGGSRSQAARLGGVTLQIIRDWVQRFNERGPAGLMNGKAPAARAALNDDQRQALIAKVDKGPTPYLDGVVRWRLCDLVQWLWEEFRLSVSRQTVGRELRNMGYRKLSARPKHHEQGADVINDFKKTSPPLWQRLPMVPPKEKL